VAPETRRGTGLVSFEWYRPQVEIPERIGDFVTAGSTVVFETVVDDYAEVWVEGSLALALGQSGGSVVAGWNVPNRRLVRGSAGPGERASIAIFAMNGPVSAPPENFIWMRRAVLAFYAAPRAIPRSRVDARLERLFPALDAVVAADARVEKLAEGFTFTEGPVCDAKHARR
jgi:gluconolactonase